MKTSYKFWYVSKDDNGYINKVTVRFYEGDYVTGTRETINPITQDIFTSEVTEYVRMKRLQSFDLPHITASFTKEDNGNDCAIYTNQDFGLTKELDDIILFVNSKLLLDTEREAETTQSIVNKSELITKDIK